MPVCNQIPYCLLLGTLMGRAERSMTSPSDTTAVVVVAAGRGTRTGHAVPKQYLSLGGRPVIAWTLERFLRHEGIDIVVPVIHQDDSARFDEIAARFPSSLAGRLTAPVFGGQTRQESVLRGLEALSRKPPDRVLVHDAARPFVSDVLIGAAVDMARHHGPAIPATRVTDTIKSIDAAGIVTGTPDRSSLRAVQTPQAFPFAPLLAAHQAAAGAGRIDFTDDGALAEWAGLVVHVFEGDVANMKLTTADDVLQANLRLSQAGLLRSRTGFGYDVHAFGPGDHVWLGGVRIPHDRGVIAHSDGDVALHALTDAILGALADGDIGTHFPPSDPAWKDASSDRFVTYAADKVAQRGGLIDHVDLAILCEAPKVGPYREAIRARIAQMCRIDTAHVSIKATTSEGLGFVGRREGLAAQAVATVRLP